MASCLISAKKAKSKSTKVPNWLKLPRDITTNILKRLDTIDIVTKACHICPLWWNIFKDPLMWRTIRMNNLRDSPNDYCLGSAYHGLDLLEIFRYAVKRSCGNLEVIDIEYFGTDDLLECVAKNVRNLQSMRAFDCCSITDAGFRKCVRKLPHLEELNISLTQLTHDSLEVLARSCPLLKSLKLSVADPVYRLSHFYMKDYDRSEVGWLAILDRCPFLESLDIKGGNVYLSENLRERCREQIKILRLPVWAHIEEHYHDDDVYLEMSLNNEL